MQNKSKKVWKIKKQLLYLNNKKYLNYHDDAKALTELKSLDGYEWLYNVNSQTLQSALKNLDAAYIKFFKKQNAFPKFHKRSNRQCIKVPQHFKVSCGKLSIPKLKSKIKIINMMRLRASINISCKGNNRKRWMICNSISFLISIKMNCSNVRTVSWKK